MRHTKGDYHHACSVRDLTCGKLNMHVSHVRVKGQDTCYIAAYMSQTRDRAFTISEVATDWHEAVVPQRTIWPFYCPR